VGGSGFETKIKALGNLKDEKVSYYKKKQKTISFSLCLCLVFGRVEHQPLVGLWVQVIGVYQLCLLGSRNTRRKQNNIERITPVNVKVPLCGNIQLGGQRIICLPSL
jgi:hypothetical protein